MNNVVEKEFFLKMLREWEENKREYVLAKWVFREWKDERKVSREWANKATVKSIKANWWKKRRRNHLQKENNIFSFLLFISDGLLYKMYGIILIADQHIFVKNF